SAASCSAATTDRLRRFVTIVPRPVRFYSWAALRARNGSCQGGALPTGPFSGLATIGGSPRTSGSSPWRAEKDPAGPFPLLSPVPHAPRLRQPDAIVWTAAPATPESI